MTAVKHFEILEPAVGANVSVTIGEGNPIRGNIVDISSVTSRYKSSAKVTVRENPFVKFLRKLHKGPKIISQPNIIVILCQEFDKELEFRMGNSEDLDYYNNSISKIISKVKGQTVMENSSEAAKIKSTRAERNLASLKLHFLSRVHSGMVSDETSKSTIEQSLYEEFNKLSEKEKIAKIKALENEVYSLDFRM